MASTTPASDKPATSWYSFSEGGGKRAFDILRTREAGVGIIAGLGAYGFLGRSVEESVVFAGLAALSNSVGDAIGSVVELPTKMEAYEYDNAYIDIADVLTGTLAGYGVLTLASRPRGMEELGLIAVACGLGGKIGGAWVGKSLEY